MIEPADHTIESPTPSPSESWNERGYAWYSTPCFHQIHPSLTPMARHAIPPGDGFGGGFAG